MCVYFKNLDLSKIYKKKTQKRRRQPINAFPVKLYRMLEEVALKGDEDIVGWSPDGLSFQVRDTTRFVNEVMSSHFKQSKYKSFQRQLNFYGFRRITNGPNEGAYCHQWFIQGNEEMCKNIRRLDTQSNKSDDDSSSTEDASSSSQPEQEVLEKEEEDALQAVPPTTNDRQESVMTFDPSTLLAEADDELNSLLKQAMPTQLALQESAALLPPTQLKLQESIILEGAPVAFGGRKFCFVASHKNLVK